MSLTYSEKEVQAILDAAQDAMSEVFIAVYGETTNDEIYAAYKAGKFVYCMSGFYILPLVYCTPSFAYFRVLSTDGSFYYRINCATDAWSNQSVVHLESRDNKVTAISADSTDDDYPSAKAVYDAIKSYVDDAIRAALANS